MAGLGQQQQSGNYLTIAEGSLRLSVPEGTEKSVRREYEIKETGQKGVKHELVYPNIEGWITDLKFEDSDYGKQLKIHIDAGKDGKYIVCMGMDSRYAMDFLKKLPNIDLKAEVRIHPYNMGEGKERKVGVSLKQGDTKIENFFFDYNAKESINGFPVMTETNPDKDDWKVFFVQVKKFLERYTTDNIIPKIQQRATKPTPGAKGTKKTETLEAGDSDFIDDYSLPF